MSLRVAARSDPLENPPVTVFMCHILENRETNTTNIEEQESQYDQYVLVLMGCHGIYTDYWDLCIYIYMNLMGFNDHHHM